MNAIIPLVGAEVSPLSIMPDKRTLLEHVVSALPSQVDLVITVAHPDLMIGQKHFGPRAWYPVNFKRTPRGVLDTLIEARGIINNSDELIINYGNCFLP